MPTAEEVVRSHFEALGRRDIDGMAELWQPEIVEDITGIGVLRGAGELREFFGGLFAAVPDLQTDVRRVVAAGDAAVVEWRMHGTFDGGPLLGIDPTGKSIELRGCDVFEVEDGKIARYTAYQDGMEMARAVGMMPARDSAAEKAMLAAFNTLTKVRGRLAG